MTLNRKQLACVWAAIAAFVVLALCPPWYEHFTAPSLRTDRLLWHAPLFDPPDPPLSNYREVRFRSIRVDGLRLLLEWSAVGAIAIGLVVTLGDHKG